MIDIPLGKALVPVEVEREGNAWCIGCWLNNSIYGCELYDDIACGREDREDGKNVIFKLVNES